MPFTSLEQLEQEQKSPSDIMIDNHQKEEADGLKGFATGIAKGIFSTIKGMGQFGTKVGNALLPKSLEIPDTWSEQALNKELNSSNPSIQSKLFNEKNLEAKNTSQKLGKFAEQTAEFILPANKLSKAEAGLNWAKKYGTRALASGAVATMQSGELGKEAGFESGAELAIPAVGKVIKPVTNFVGRLVKNLGAGVSGVNSEVLDQIIKNPQLAKEAKKILNNIINPSKYIDAIIKSGNLKSLIESVKTGSGGTLNIDGSMKDLTNDFIVSLRSKNIPNTKLNEKEITNFIKSNKDFLKEFGDKVKVGVFDLGDGTVSLDLNLALKNQDDAIKLASLGKQQSIFDEATAKMTNFGDESFIKTGFDGKTPVDVSIEEIKKVIPSFDGNLEILKSNSQKILNGVSQLKKEASDAFSKGLENLKNIDVDINKYRAGVSNLFTDYGFNPKTFKFTNVDFKDPLNIKKSMRVAKMLNETQLDGASVRKLMKDIGDMASKSGSTEEARAFNAFVRDISSGLKNILSESSPVFNNMNKKYSTDIQLAEAIQGILGDVKFKSQDELIDVSKNLEKIFTKNPLENEAIDNFFKRIGLDGNQLKTSEAVRQISNKGINNNQMGLSFDEIFRTVSSSIVSPKTVRDIAIMTGISQQALEKVMLSKNPYVREMFIKTLNDLTTQDELDSLTPDNIIQDTTIPKNFTPLEDINNNQTTQIDDDKLADALMQLESSGGTDTRSADEGEVKWLTGLTNVAINELKRVGLLESIDVNNKEEVLKASTDYFNYLRSKNPDLTPAEVYVDKYWNGWKKLKNGKEIRAKKIAQFNELFNNELALR